MNCHHRPIAIVASNDTISLGKSHSHYYQIQLQIFVSGQDYMYCDVFVWGSNDHHVERIVTDEIFKNSNAENAFYFHK